MFSIVDSQRRCKELIVPVLIDEKSVDMGLDTSASMTIIPKTVCTDILAAKPLQQTGLKLSSYLGHDVPVVSSCWGSHGPCIL